MTLTVTMSEPAATDVRDAIAAELLTQTRAIVRDLEAHHGGSDVALADATWKIRVIGRLVAVLDDLEPQTERAAEPGPVVEA